MTVHRKRAKARLARPEGGAALAPSVQPEGVLLVLEPKSLTVTHVSANVADLLGLPPSAVLGLPIDALLDRAYCAKLAAYVGARKGVPGPAGLVALEAGGWKGWRAASHRTSGGLVVEMAPPPETSPELEGFLVEATLALRGVAEHSGIDAASAAIVRRLREMTGYDCAAVIRCDGERTRTIAESRAETSAPSLLSGHDLAARLRAVLRSDMLAAPVRLLRDLAATPVDLIAAPRRSHHAKPDLSAAILRAPGPGLVRLLAPLGVRSALFVALFREKQLWGMLAFLHRMPHRLSLPYRATLQLMADSIAVRFAAAEAFDLQRRLSRRRSALTALQRSFDRDAEDDPRPMLERHGKTLLRIAGADSAWFDLPDGDFGVGPVPAPDHARGIVASCRARAAGPVLAVDDLGALDRLSAASPEVSGRALYAALPHARGALVFLRRMSAPSGAGAGKAAGWSAADIGLAAEIARVIDELVPRLVQRRSLRRVSENEAKLRAILEATQDGLVVVDRAGTIVEFSPGAERLFGWSGAEIVGRGVEILIPAPLRARHRAKFARAGHRIGARVLGGDGSLRAKRKDGSDFPFELTLASLVIGGETLFIGAMRDITERLNGEQRERFWFSHSSVGYSVSTLAGRRLRANPALCSILGYSERELLERDLHATYYAEDAVASRAWRERVRAGEDVPYRAVQRFWRKDGRMVWGRVTASPLRLPGADDPLIVSELVDITDLMEADATRRAALVRAEAASAAKSQFLAAMSHELRTPLNAIIGLSDMMVAQVMGPIGNPRYAEYISDIGRAGRHLLDLVTDVLDTSRIEAGGYRVVPSPIALAGVVEEIHRIMLPLATERGVTLRRSLRDGVSAIHADRRALKQVLINIVSNALKFTPSGGVVEVAAVGAPDGGVEIVVADTGSGIAAEDLPHIVEPFYRSADAYTTTAAGGAGLGLAIADGIVRAHGGSLAIASRLGAGTTVTLRFPPPPSAA
ncbi:MAG: PAS domain S-box protein [Rhodospirillaceae bacterium]|nr:PAS domain S-box protein [Rhodospirillaceae bacterium]